MMERDHRVVVVVPVPVAPSRVGFDNAVARGTDPRVYLVWRSNGPWGICVSVVCDELSHVSTMTSASDPFRTTVDVALVVPCLSRLLLSISPLPRFFFLLPFFFIVSSASPSCVSLPSSSLCSCSSCSGSAPSPTDVICVSVQAWCVSVHGVCPSKRGVTYPTRGFLRRSVTNDVFHLSIRDGSQKSERDSTSHITHIRYVACSGGLFLRPDIRQLVAVAGTSPLMVVFGLFWVSLAASCFGWRNPMHTAPPCSTQPSLQACSTPAIAW